MLEITKLLFSGVREAYRKLLFHKKTRAAALKARAHNRDVLKAVNPDTFKVCPHSCIEVHVEPNKIPLLTWIELRYCTYFIRCPKE